MTICEFQVESFHARGNDDYLDDFAAHLDRLFASGWKAIDSERDTHPGWGRLWLYKEVSGR